MSVLEEQLNLTILVRTRIILFEDWLETASLKLEVHGNEVR